MSIRLGSWTFWKEFDRKGSSCVFLTEGKLRVSNQWNCSAHPLHDDDVVVFTVHTRLQHDMLQVEDPSTVKAF